MTTQAQVRTKSRVRKKKAQRVTRSSFDAFFSAGPVSQIRSANQGLEVATVYRCVNLISDSLAMVPIKILEGEIDQDKKPNHDHALFKLLNFKPNSYESAFVFKKQMFQSLLLSGNAYVLPLGEELHLLDPRSVQPERIFGSLELFYRVTDRAGNSLGILTNQEILHLRYCTRDGIRGESPIMLHQEVVQSEDSAERFQRDALDSRQMPIGIITMPEAMDAERTELIRSQWASIARTGRPAVLEEGAKFQQISMTQEQAQFLASRNYTSVDIATKVFGLPPSKVGVGTGDRYSLEEESQMVIDAVLPFATVVAEEFRNFYWPNQLQSIELMFDLNKLKRYNITVQNERFQRGIAHGWFNPNEARQELGYSPRKGGDVYLTPVNMIHSDYAEEWAQKQCESSAKVNTLKETARNIFRYTIRRFVCQINDRAGRKDGITSEWAERIKREMEVALPDVISLLLRENSDSAKREAVGKFISGFEMVAAGIEDRCQHEVVRLERIIQGGE